ncbi:hypothetical protein NA57DRAFT_61384 [Rhizodiscina lignyota]|uniref:Cell wall mannoprotein PIR1-like C-terminal domain-containing protein n=1 Tax=Rhizodiscina lignyota TaxID=1504668 RepID=A0A9P4I758_9PEZI|nr:hypothetical protein NA57DRAFT_61384 [Rhizodiscina lignyota]
MAPSSGIRPAVVLLISAVLLNFAQSVLAASSTKILTMTNLIQPTRMDTQTATLPADGSCESSYLVPFAIAYANVTDTNAPVTFDSGTPDIPMPLIYVTLQDNSLYRLDTGMPIWIEDANNWIVFDTPTQGGVSGVQYEQPWSYCKNSNLVAFAGSTTFWDCDDTDYWGQVGSSNNSWPGCFEVQIIAVHNLENAPASHPPITGTWTQTTRIFTNPPTSSHSVSTSGTETWLDGTLVTSPPRSLGKRTMSTPAVPTSVITSTLATVIPTGVSTVMKPDTTPASTCHPNYPKSGSPVPFQLKVLDRILTNDQLGTPAKMEADNKMVTLKDGMIFDAQNRIFSVVSNFQLEYDNPPQDTAIYTAGWYLCDNGTITLGSWLSFTACNSENAGETETEEKLYLQNGAGQCKPAQILGPSENGSASFSNIPKLLSSTAGHVPTGRPKTNSTKTPTNSLPAPPHPAPGKPPSDRNCRQSTGKAFTIGMKGMYNSSPNATLFECQNASCRLTDTEIVKKTAEGSNVTFVVSSLDNSLIDPLNRTVSSETTLKYNAGWHICDNNILTLGSAITFAYCPQTANSSWKLVYGNTPPGCHYVFLYAAFPNDTTWIPTYWDSSELNNPPNSSQVLTATDAFASAQVTPTWGPVPAGSNEYANSAFYIFTVPWGGKKLEWTDHQLYTLQKGQLLSVPDGDVSWIIDNYDVIEPGPIHDTAISYDAGWSVFPNGTLRISNAPFSRCWKECSSPYFMVGPVPNCTSITFVARTQAQVDEYPYELIDATLPIGCYSTSSSSTPLVPTNSLSAPISSGGVLASTTVSGNLSKRALPSTTLTNQQTLQERQGASFSGTLTLPASSSASGILTAGAPGSSVSAAPQAGSLPAAPLLNGFNGCSDSSNNSLFNVRFVTGGDSTDDKNAQPVNGVGDTLYTLSGTEILDPNNAGVAVWVVDSQGIIDPSGTASGNIKYGQGWYLCSNGPDTWLLTLGNQIIFPQCNINGVPTLVYQDQDGTSNNALPSGCSNPTNGFLVANKTSNIWDKRSLQEPSNSIGMTRDVNNPPPPPQCVSVVGECIASITQNLSCYILRSIGGLVYSIRTYCATQCTQAATWMSILQTCNYTLDSAAPAALENICSQNNDPNLLLHGLTVGLCMSEFDSADFWNAFHLTGPTPNGWDNVYQKCQPSLAPWAPATPSTTVGSTGLPGGAKMAEQTPTPGLGCLVSLQNCVCCNNNATCDYAKAAQDCYTQASTDTSWGCQGTIFANALSNGQQDATALAASPEQCQAIFKNRNIARRSIPLETSVPTAPDAALSTSAPAFCDECLSSAPSSTSSTDLTTFLTEYT